MTGDDMNQASDALAIGGHRVLPAETAGVLNPASEPPICEYPLHGLADHTHVQAVMVEALS